MKKVFLILVVFGGVLIASSCSDTCKCTDKNTGEEYPEIDYKKEGFKNCRELEKAINANGTAVNCSKL